MVCSSPGWPGLAWRGARLVEVGEQRLAVLLVDLRADRHLEHDIAAVGAVAVLAHAVTAALRLVMLLEAVVDQGVEPLDRARHDVAAAPAVAAAGAAAGDEFFAAEGETAVAAVAGLDFDDDFIDEHGGSSNAKRPRKLAFPRPDLSLKTRSRAIR
jgi:hypothetical protein